MTIPTTTDILGAISTVYPVIGALHDPHATALITALNHPSPVDKAVYATEALYAAIMQDATLTGAELVKVASACAQTAFLVTNYQWHGKAQRCAEISVALNLIVDGTAPAATTGPAVDEQFAPPPAATPMAAPLAVAA